MDKGIKKGYFYPHDKTVAMGVASVIVNTENNAVKKVTEDDLFERERKAFINLAQTQKTYERISSLLEKGINLRN